MEQPKWKVLAEELALECAQLRPGEPLRSVRQLIAEGRGSRTTIADAFGELVRRGLVRGKPGASYVVLPRRTGPVRLARHLVPQGTAGRSDFNEWRLPGRRQLISHGFVEPPAGAAIKLGLAEDNLTVLRSTHYFDEGADGCPENGPFLSETTWYPESVARALGLADKPNVGTSELLAGLTPADVGSTREQVRYRPASDAEAETLGLPYGGAVVQIERVLYDGAGSPVQLHQLVAPASITELVTESLPAAGPQDPA